MVIMVNVLLNLPEKHPPNPCTCVLKYTNSTETKILLTIDDHQTIAYKYFDQGRRIRYGQVRPGRTNNCLEMIGNSP